MHVIKFFNKYSDVRSKLILLLIPLRFCFNTLDYNRILQFELRTTKF